MQDVPQQQASFVLLCALSVSTAGSLSREVHEVCYNGVTSLYQQQMGRSGCQQLMSNARHILRCVVTGIAYLHEELYIQHADLKGMHVHVHVELRVTIKNFAPILFCASGQG